MVGIVCSRGGDYIMSNQPSDDLYGNMSETPLPCNSTGRFLNCFITVLFFLLFF